MAVEAGESGSNTSRSGRYAPLLALVMSTLIVGGSVNGCQKMAAAVAPVPSGPDDAAILAAVNAYFARPRGLVDAIPSYGVMTQNRRISSMRVMSHGAYDPEAKRVGARVEVLFAYQSRHHNREPWADRQLTGNYDFIVAESPVAVGQWDARPAPR